MTKEKWERVTKCVINIGLIIGLVILGALVILSFVGIILSLRCVLDLLSISVSVFISAMGSFLTILALIITVKSNNEMNELKKAENISNAIRSINLIRNSLYLEKIEIDRSLISKEVTHLNSSVPKKNWNLRIGLIFSAQNIHELNNISLEKFGLYFKQKTSDGNSPSVFLEYDNPQFYPIQNANPNTFLYEIITNISDSDYHGMIQALKTPDCGLEVDMCLVLQSVEGMEIIWRKNNHNRPIFHLTKFDGSKQRYYFK